jgi:hypothetical protein
MRISRLQLISKPENGGRHVVILGAGASVAAFPQGDANGRRLPTMDNLTAILGLGPSLERTGLTHEGLNFEAVYSDLHTKSPDSPSIREINEAVYAYFGELRLPEQPTLYDHLLLSLRPKDLVATFNWDPFLYDAWDRNVSMAPLPKTVYLHGNVRIGYCQEHRIKGENGTNCPECDKELVPSRLLYPVATKNYSDDIFIESEWKLLRWYLREALTLTIIGYSAPDTDKEAVDVMNGAWDKGKRLIERTEVVDIKEKDVLFRQWNPFVVRTYFDCHKDFYQSRIANYPRRTCEALLDMTRYGLFVESNPLPINADFEQLVSWMGPLVEAERDGME